MQKKRWIPLAVLAAVILGAGHVLVDGDWYIVRVLKDQFSGFAAAPKDSMADAQRQLTEVQKDIAEAKRQLLKAQQAAAEAKRQMTEAQQNEAAPEPPKLTIPEGAEVEFIHELPPLVFQSPGVVWNRTDRKSLAPFGIRTASGFDYFVKLVEAETGRDAVAVYVSGGKPVEVAVPLGTYVMRYAYGKTWYGEEHRFGPGEMTRYSAAMRGSRHETFRFAEDGNSYTGYTVELIKQTGGNLPTKTISADQF